MLEGGGDRCIISIKLQTGARHGGRGALASHRSRCCCRRPASRDTIEEEKRNALVVDLRPLNELELVLVAVAAAAVDSDAQAAEGGPVGHGSLALADLGELLMRQGEAEGQHPMAGQVAKASLAKGLSIRG